MTEFDAAIRRAPIRKDDRDLTQIRAAHRFAARLLIALASLALVVALMIGVQP